MSLRLKDCTKPELLFVIQQLKFHCGSSGEYYLMQALGDVRMQRLEAHHVEADRLSNLAYSKRQEYISLLNLRKKLSLHSGRIRCSFGRNLCPHDA